jgi:hypothetical protein
MVSPHHQAGLIDKAEGRRGVVQEDVQQLEHVADAQVVPESSVRVLIGEDGVLVVVFLDFSDFHLHPDRAVLRNRKQCHACQCKGGKKSFHISDL